MNQFQPDDASRPTPSPDALTCQVCGSHDPSVRQVSYPYVVSILVLTFRREFRGRWCWKHRWPYLLLAGVITATVGLLGFPFGLIYAPTVLFGLAKGAGLDRLSNFNLLCDLAETHRQRGALDEARRCLENSLQFVSGLWELRQFKASNDHLQTGVSVPSGRGGFRSPWAAFGVLALAALAGGVTGLGSHYVDRLFELFSGDVADSLGLFLHWILLVALPLALIFSLRQLLEQVWENHPRRSALLIVGLGLATSVLAAYGFLEGRQIGDFLDLLLQDRPHLPGGADLWKLLAAVLLRGGWLEFSQTLARWEAENFFHHLVLAGIPLIFLAIPLLAAHPYLRWQRLLNKIRRESGEPARFSWAPVLAGLAPWVILAGLGALIVAFPQQSVVDFMEARDHLYRGNALANQDRLPRARSEYELAARLDPLYAQAYINQGWIDALNGDFSAAIEQYLRGLELNPDLADARYELAKIYYDDDQLEKAQVEFEKTIQIDPGRARAYSALGWIAYYQDDLERAETQFRKALTLDDEYEAHLGLGLVYRERDQLDQAVAAFEQAVKSNPKSGDTQFLLGQAYYDQNEHERAVEPLRAAVRLEPDDQPARMYLIRSYLYIGQPDAALEFSRETVQRFPSWAGGHALLAYALLDTRQAAEAVAELQFATRIGARTDHDHRLIIGAWLRARRPVEAQAQAQAAIASSRSPADFYLALAEAYSAQEKYDLAFEACERAAALGSWPADVFTQRGSIYLDQDHADRSLAELERALKLDPRLVGAHYLSSLAYSGQEDLKSALEHAQQAIALDRYYYNAYLHLALIQGELGNTDEVIRAATRAAQLSPYADIPHFYLGMAYLQAGLDRSAATELQKFLDLYEGLPSEQELKEDAERALEKLKRGASS